MEEYEENCFIKNGKQSVKLRSGSIKFKNYFKQLAVSFKIYVDFESLLRRFRSNDKNGHNSYTEKYQDYIPWSFAYKVVRVDEKFGKKVVLYTGNNVVYKFIETVLEEYYYYRKNVIKKYLAMSAEDEERFHHVIRMDM